MPRTQPKLNLKLQLELSSTQTVTPRFSGPGGCAANQTQLQLTTQTVTPQSNSTYNSNSYPCFSGRGGLAPVTGKLRAELRAELRVTGSYGQLRASYGQVTGRLRASYGQGYGKVTPPVERARAPGTGEEGSTVRSEIVTHFWTARRKVGQ